MPFCKNCGASVQGQFCPKCGTPAVAPPAEAQAPPAAAPQPQAGPYYAPAPQPGPPGYGPPPQPSAPAPQPQAGPYYAPAPPQGPPPGPPPGYGPQPGYGPPPQPGAPAPGLTDNLAALLCYVPPLICGIVFLVMQPYCQKKFIRFHAFQSIFFGIVLIAVQIVWGIFVTVLFSMGWAWRAATLFGLLGTLLWLAFLVIWVFLLIKAHQGVMYKLPLIGDLAEKQA